MIKIETPLGAAGRIFLAKPDTKFGTTAKFRANVTLTAADAAPILAACREGAVRAFGLKRGVTVRMSCDENADGTITFKFRSRDRPVVYGLDSKVMGLGHLQNLRIGDGSNIRVVGEARTYEGFGGGVMLYLLEVHLIRILEPGQLEAHD